MLLPILISNFTYEITKLAWQRSLRLSVKMAWKFYIRDLKIEVFRSFPRTTNVEKSREPGPSRQVCGLRLTFVRLDHAPQGFLHPKTSQSQV